ncbi:effector binding domain-containing protein [Paenibacillus sp. YN15]|uniref:effector binding domain-containing protein n=1 Tax=Paenibacillus sp. YN15 TaxID=1742774 RepID=UPI000DCBCC25|nr:effector binding domain-containing protein [Paenibacillus sp. YN15]RAV00230.1 AraC family transcriptional regulator [Paenibacillus sp. YN15]
MSSFAVQEKEAFRFIGYKTRLEASGQIHAPSYSPAKTEFFKSILQSGKLAALRPMSESPYGYGVVAADKGGTFYYAGIVTSQPAVEGTEEVLFPKGPYLVLSGKGGLSRLAFDKLEDQAFAEVLTEDYRYRYSGGPIAEVLLNGNPMDAEVEIWIPVEE